MTSFEPASPTLADIAAGDIINYKGESCVIDSVGSYVDNGGGRGHIAVTLDDSANVDHVITCSTADTVLSSYHIDAAGKSQATWSQTVDA